MERFLRVVCSLGLLWGLSGCGAGGDQPESSLLIDTPAAARSTLQTSDTSQNPHCTPDTASGGGVTSRFRLSGPCDFTESAPARCVKRTDDYYVYVHQDLPDDGRFILTVNVESYKRPGVFQHGAQIYIEVTRHGTFYYWNVNSVTVTVKPGETELVVDKVEVPAQAGTPAHGTITVEGTLRCPSVT
jgi:hypothetical protein